MQDQQPDDKAAALDRARRLQAFADSLANSRREAVDFKKQTGVEREWEQLEELYDGIDDSNRSTYWEKPTNTTGGLVQAKPTTPTGSSIFLNIFQPYVDMGAARACEILVPTNDKPFGLRHTPMLDVEKAGNDPVAEQTMIDNGRGQQTTVANAVKLMLNEAREAADKAETRIWDWWTEWRWQSEGRKMIDMASKIGTSVLKGPFPKRFKSKKVNKGPGGAVAIEMVEGIKPVSKVIHPKNFYPDPACGENIHDGSFVWERDTITAKQLRELMNSVDSEGSPIYLNDQIKHCLIEGPGKKYESGQKPGDKDKFEIWYYHGAADHENMAAAGCECDETEVMNVSVFTVNDRVIKAKLNTLDSGEFPYDVMVWQAKPGTWTGIGIGHQIRTPQEMLNAGARNLMDNAGFACAPIIIFDDELIENADDSGDMTLRPRMVLRKKYGVTMTKASDAITSITIPSMQADLMGIINFALTMGERVTGMAIQQQGQQGENEETAAGRQILQANAGALMRRICKIFDDRMAPHVSRYYEWLLIYGDDPAEKGDFIIDVLGSTIMFERDAKNMLVAQMLDRAANPIYGLNPEKMAKEWLKGQGLDVDRIEYTDDEKKSMAEQAAQQPKDPSVEVANIRKESAAEVQQIRSQESVQKSKMDTDRDTLFEQTRNQLVQATQDYQERKLAMEREIAILKENGDMARKLKDSEDKAEALKVKLAETVMELKMQAKLAAGDRAAEQVADDAVEPVGKAPPGEAFQR